NSRFPTHDTGWRRLRAPRARPMAGAQAGAGAEEFSRGRAIVSWLVSVELLRCCHSVRQAGEPFTTDIRRSPWPLHRIANHRRARTSTAALVAARQPAHKTPAVFLSARSLSGFDGRGENSAV